MNGPMADAVQPSGRKSEFKRTSPTGIVFTQVARSVPSTLGASNDRNALTQCIRVSKIHRSVN